MFIPTPRLLLRPGWPEDAPALLDGIGREDVVRNLARAPWPYRLPDAERYCREGFGDALPSFFIVERTARGPALIGGIGFGRLGPEVELGYWLRPDRWGQGFATEAGRAVIALARDGLRLPRLTAGHFTDNPASGRVLTKLGFRPAGPISKRHSVARGTEASFIPYALLLGRADGVERQVSLG